MARAPKPSSTSTTLPSARARASRRPRPGAHEAVYCRRAAAAARPNRTTPKKLDLKYWVTLALAVIAIVLALESDQKLTAIEDRVNSIYTHVASPKPTSVSTTPCSSLPVPPAKHSLKTEDRERSDSTKAS